MRTDQPNRRLSLPGKTVLLAFFLAIILGGGNAVAIRFTLRELPPLWAASLRLGGAAVLLWAIALARKAPLPPRRALPGVLLYGFLGFGIPWAFIYWGLGTLEAGMAQVLMALTPLLTFLFAVLHRQETFRWRGLVGALIAVAGIAWSFFEHPEGGAALLPMLAIVAGAACLAESLVLLKRLPAMDPSMTNAVGISTGAASLLILSRLFGEAWSLPALPVTWLALIYVVVLGSAIFFSLLIFVVRRWTASASAYALVLMPFETVVLSAWLTGEHVNAGLLIGGALVLIGVWIGALAGPVVVRAPEAPVAATGEAH